MHIHGDKNVFHLTPGEVENAADINDINDIGLTLSCKPCAAGEAFVTLATTDSYCMGAIVVARSLQRHGTTRSTVVMVTPNLSQQSRWAINPLNEEVDGGAGFGP